MPSTATITSFYNFTALTVIRSAQVNTNFDTFRGHIIPVDPSTATSAATMTYDLGSIDHMWRGQFNQYGIMYANTAGSVPTVPTTTAYALYFKSDGNLYKKDSIGNESSFITAAGNLNVASTTGGFTLTNSNDVVLANISASASTYNLFTAVGNSGKEITIKKIDSTSNIVTIDANSTETIDGDLTTTLNTQYESIKLISDGSNWHILERKINESWISYTPTFTGFGTVSNVDCYYQRNGDSLNISIKFTCGTSTATEARISLPTGITIGVFGATKYHHVGRGTRDNAGASFSRDFGVFAINGNSYVVFSIINNSGSTSGEAAQNGSSFTVSGDDVVFMIRNIPITGWKGN